MPITTIFPLVAIPKPHLDAQGVRIFPLDFDGTVDVAFGYDPFTADDEFDEQLDDEGDFLEPEVTGITPELLADLRAEQAEREKVIGINSTNHHPTISPTAASNLEEARNSDQPRHPKGTPVGGQFAPKSGGLKITSVGKTQVDKPLREKVESVVKKLPEKAKSLLAEFKAEVEINTEPGSAYGRYRPFDMRTGQGSPTAVVYQHDLTEEISEYHGEMLIEQITLHELGHACSALGEAKAQGKDNRAFVHLSDRTDFQELTKDTHLQKINAASKGEDVEGRFSKENLRIHRVAPEDLAYIAHYWSSDEIFAQAFAVAVMRRENIPITSPTGYIFEQLFGDVISHVEGLFYDN